MELSPESQQSVDMLKELLRAANIGEIDQHYCVALHEAIEAIENQAWIENEVRHQIGGGDWWHVMHEIHIDWSLPLSEAVAKCRFATAKQGALIIGGSDE